VRTRLWTLWTLETALWIAATLLRASRVWAPVIGWHRILASPRLWISLAVPPLLLALILRAVRGSISADRSHRRDRSYTT
jgi:hypothetical protein